MTVDRKVVLDGARSESGDDNVLDMLGRIPDRRDDGPNAISNEIGAFE